MAEAFGIAGSAFGTVSLGLKLFQEISQYIDDIDGREEDLKEARDYATNIQLALNALDIAISNAPTGDHATKSAIDSCRASCVNATNHLLEVVKELRGPIASSPNSNAAKARGLYAKMKYPFKKQHMEKLEEILSRTNGALQTILDVFQLKTGHATTTAISNMYQAVAELNAISEKNKTALDEIHKTSQLHDDRLGTIQEDVKELLILTRDSEDAKLLLRTMAQQVSDLASRSNVSANLLQNPGCETFIPSIQTTNYQGGGSIRFNAFCSCKTQRVRYSQRHWGPFLLEAEVRSRDHHAPECAMSKLPESTRRTKRVLTLLIPTSQRLWGHATQVSLSFTTGGGILGLGQTVAWIATVDERVSPVFRRLVWCYANSHASITDVNEGGETILGWALCNYPIYHDALTAADNMADLFEMLTIISEPTSRARKLTAEPVGHHHSWYVSWSRDKEYASSGHRLLQVFPQAVETLEIGPLTLAVLKQDRNEVQQLLERYPSYINEKNHCGQSPVHLAIETESIFLLQYADAKALSARDNLGYYPIDYVSTRQWKHTGGDQADCNGCKLLELMLRLETALFPTSLRIALRLPWYKGHSCVRGHKIIIKVLAERRERLKELSYRWLSPAEREGLEIHPTRILDQNAARVQHQLEAQGCAMPTCLSVYEEDIESLYDYESIYSLISGGEVAEYAHQLGFYYSDNEYADFISGLASHMALDIGYSTMRPNHTFSSSYLCWMIDHGTSVSSGIPVERLPTPAIEMTAVHYFMASSGSSGSWVDENDLTLDCPLSVAAVEMVFSETIVDRCRCWCSPGGCTPLTKLLEGISRWTMVLFAPNEDLSRTTERLTSALLLGHRDKISDSQWIHAAIIRYYTFVGLGLRHVCCSIVMKASGPLPEGEIQEIEEEDSSLLGLFETLLKEFEGDHLHGMSLEDFFIWMRMTWAPRMQDVKEELASQRLTDEQLRDAESVGVIWEACRPKLMDESSEVSELDLWDAMDELDQIATDPERPMKEISHTHTSTVLEFPPIESFVNSSGASPVANFDLLT
ncbi:hypothetical protein FPANT_6444 [Fusarium pseudoanthophilum]|uniref:Fungal N-terminal domain-containing protein n=1 Tax=Fusarium pseudoanthophilum TaxID=48495 RepID=A0A8H5LEM6_9HYPO|nr:hypothetical protein FPANT_6444 [Fusarium pseudoanthophilum]